jgi:hypothetical protein
LGGGQKVFELEKLELFSRSASMNAEKITKYMEVDQNNMIMILLVEKETHTKKVGAKNDGLAECNLIGDELSF